MLNKLIKLAANEYLLLAAIIVVSFAFKTYKINSPLADWHSFRQADTASVSRMYLKDGISLLYPKYHDLSGIQSGQRNDRGYRFVEFPLYNAIHVLFIRLFGGLSLEIWGRLTTIFFTTISAVLLFLIAKEVFNKWVGVLSAFFFSFLPYSIFYSRVILPEPLATMLSLLSVYLFMRYVKSQNLSTFVFSAVALALSALIRPFTVFYLILISYLYIERFGLRNSLKRGNLFVRLMVYLTIIIVPFFAWRWWIDKHPEGVPYYEWIFNLGGMRFHPSFWRWIFGERIGYLILGIWGIFPFVLGLIYRNGKNYFLQVFLLVALVYVSVFAAGNIRHDYYQYFIIPQISMTLAYGVYLSVTQKNFIKPVSIALVVFSVFMMLGISAYQVKEYYKINHPEIIEAGNFVDKNTPPDSEVIASYNGDTAFLYQTNRSGWPVVDDSIENLIRWGADYFVSVNFGDNDLKYVTERYKTIERNDKFVVVDLNQKIQK